MKKEELSAAMSDIDIKFIEEAENYNMSKRKIIKRPLSRMAVAAIVIGCLVFGGVAYAGTTLTDWKSVISFFDDKFFKKVENKTKVDKDTIISLATKLQKGNLKDESTLREIISTLSALTGKDVSKAKEDKIVDTILKDKVPKSVDKMF